MMMRVDVLRLFRHPTGADYACSVIQQGLQAAKVLTKPAAPSSPTTTPQPLAFSPAHRAVPERGLHLSVAIIAALLTSKFSGAC
jgi:hypothetical protein